MRGLASPLIFLPLWIVVPLTVAAASSSSSPSSSSRVVIAIGRGGGSRDGLLRSENVFGWQKQKRRDDHEPIDGGHNPSSDSGARPSVASPLKRIENVFGWQQRRRKDEHSSSPSSQLSSSPQLPSPPSIPPLPPLQIRPRKEELWLP